MSSDYRSSMFERLFTLVEQWCALELRCFSLSPPTIDEDGTANWSLKDRSEPYLEAGELRRKINDVFDEIQSCVADRHWSGFGVQARLAGLKSALESLDTWREGVERQIPVTVDDCQLWLDRKITETRDQLERLKPVAEKMARESGKPTSDVAHAPDFRSVSWFGESYTFTPTQAACVKVMWRYWEQRTPALSELTILDEAGSSGDRLRDVFDKGKHPAWGTMITPAGKGAFQLAENKKS
ncbi:MAG: hypothetical protein ABI614_03855 [Planctomycetota bacterium]